MTGTIERLNFPHLVEAGDAPFCNVVRDGHYAYLAGIVAADFPRGRATLGDVAAETTSVMHAVQMLLEEIGLTMSDVVRCDVHLTDLDDMPAMNSAYAGFFAAGQFPARTCTQAGALFGGSKVEITCIARQRAQ